MEIPVEDDLRYVNEHREVAEHIRSTYVNEYREVAELSVHSHRIHTEPDSPHD